MELVITAVRADIIDFGVAIAADSAKPLTHVGLVLFWPTLHILG
jgi:hypothetical protein